MKETERPSQADLLDWTITDAPDWNEPDPTDDEAERPDAPAGAQPAHPSAEGHSLRFSRWTWLRIGGVIALSALILGLYAAWNRVRVDRAVRSVIALEEQAALARDVETIARLTAEGQAAWLSAQTQRVLEGRASPSPAALLLPVRHAGVVTRIRSYSANVVRADVSRQFWAPGAGVMTFSLPQFYIYNEGWKRIAPPEGFASEHSQFDGQFVTVSYSDEDGVQGERLASYLDEVVGQACAEWSCPQGFRVGVLFSPEAAAYDGPQPPESRPLLFALMRSLSTQWLESDGLLLPPPQLAGSAADPGAEAWLRRVIALQVLTKAGQQLTANGQSDPLQNAFLYALIARAAARLDLDHLPAAQPSANTLLDGRALWDLGDTAAWQQPAARDQALRGALDILGILLDGQSPPAEAALLAEIRTPTYGGPEEWLLGALDLPYTETDARLRAAGGVVFHAESLSAPPGHLALSCLGGPGLLSLDQGRVQSYLSGPLLSAHPVAWSPDGRRLALALSGQPAVIDFAEQSLRWLPEPPAGDLLYADWWASDSVVAYLHWRRPALPSDIVFTSLSFFDVSDPERAFPVVPDVETYVLSPSRQAAAVVQEVGVGFRNGQISVMPAMGGPLVPVGVGRWPVWSPDGQALAYLHFDESSLVFSIRVVTGFSRTHEVKEGDTLWTIAQTYGVSVLALAEANGLESEVIQAGQVLDIPVEAGSPGLATVEIIRSQDIDLVARREALRLAWSPAGDQLALLATRLENEETTLLLMSTDGLRRNWTLNQKFYAGGPPQYSADGRYVAVGGQTPGGEPMVYVYDTASRFQTKAWSGVWQFAWSPEGHQLAGLAPDGVYVLAHPGDRPRRAAGGACYRALWRPEGGK